jgi:hypothetical protein
MVTAFDRPAASPTKVQRDAEPVVGAARENQPMASFVAASNGLELLDFAV